MAADAPVSSRIFFIAITVAGDEKYAAVMYHIDIPQDKTGRARHTEISSIDLKKGTNAVYLKGLEPGLYRLQVREIRPDMIMLLEGISFTVYRNSK